MLRIAENPGPSIAPALVPEPEFALVEATHEPALLTGYRALRRDAFVHEQGLFDGHDLDAFDEDARTRVLVVVDRARRVLGGVRIHPAILDGPELAWWRGSRLVARPLPGVRAGEIGAHLVTGACRLAEHECGALRFDAHVQEHCEAFFARLGWKPHRHAGDRRPAARADALAGRPDRPARPRHEGAARRLLDGTLQVDGLLAAFVGDDAAPVPGEGGLSWPAPMRSCPRWRRATPSGPGGAACSSRRTTSPRWALPPSPHSTPSGRAMPLPPAVCCVAYGMAPRCSTCRSSAATRSSASRAACR